MRELEKPVARVFRRLRLQRFVSSLVWVLAIALLLVAVVLGVSKALNHPLPGPEWAPFAVAGGLGALIATLIAIFTGPSRLDAAVAIDHAFHLNERVSTALTLPGDLRETSVGHALLADARKKLADLDVTAGFGPKLPRKAWIALIPAGMAVAMLFVPTWIERTVQARTEVKVDAKALAKQSETLSKKISSQRQVIDGAFVVRGDGVVLAAGRYLAPRSKLEEPLPQGLGTRHEAAASITVTTDAIAVCVSQSTGTVSIFKRGRMILDIQKPRGRGADGL